MPLRKGLSSTIDEDMIGVEVVCAKCEELTTLQKLDDGIGAYEYWGTDCYDSRPYIGTECCESKEWHTPEEWESIKEDEDDER